MTAQPVISHRWDVSPGEARQIQHDLRGHLVVVPMSSQPEIVAGIDVSVRHGEARSAAVLLSFPDLEPIEAATAREPACFPYIPGLLAFREGPVVLKAVAKLAKRPDVLVFDAHGLAHPRRAGLATHLGILLDMPSVGCAKTRLCGEYSEPGEEKGAWKPVYDGDEVIGAVVRTRDNVNPVFVSVGHRVDLESAVSLVIDCAPRYRLPETTRWAHRVARGGTLPASNPRRDSIR